MIEFVTPWYRLVISIAGCLLLLVSSGFVVRFIFKQISESAVMEKIGKEARDTGFIIGKCENLLIFSFVLFGQFTALAIIFAAKAIVRREDMSRNTLYFLAGTMINVTYSVLVAIATVIVLQNI